MFVKNNFHDMDIINLYIHTDWVKEKWGKLKCISGSGQCDTLGSMARSRAIHWAQ
jgi:hypothetical protein